MMEIEGERGALNLKERCELWGMVAEDGERGSKPGKSAAAMGSFSASLLSSRPQRTPQRVKKKRVDHTLGKGR